MNCVSQEKTVSVERRKQVFGKSEAHRKLSGPVRGRIEAEKNRRQIKDVLSVYMKEPVPNLSEPTKKTLN